MSGVTSVPHKCAFHALIAAYLKLVVFSRPEHSDTYLRQHVDAVVERRQKSAPFLLPEIAFHRQHAQMLANTTFFIFVFIYNYIHVIHAKLYIHF